MKTCWECSIRIGEECGIDGREVFPDSEACDNFCGMESLTEAEQAFLDDYTQECGF